MSKPYDASLKDLLTAPAGRLVAVGHGSAELDRATAIDLWAITATLAGLRVDRQLIQKLMGGIVDLLESSLFEFAGEEIAKREVRKIR